MCDRAVPIAPAPPIEISGGACHADEPAPAYATEGGERGARLARRVNALAIAAASSRSPIIISPSTPADTNAPTLKGAADRLRAQGAIFDEVPARVRRGCARRPKATNRAAMQRASRRRNRGRR